MLGSAWRAAQPPAQSALRVGAQGGEVGATPHAPLTDWKLKCPASGSRESWVAAAVNKFSHEHFTHRGLGSQDASSSTKGPFVRL